MGKAIVVDSLVKNFEVTQRKSGLKGTISSLLHPVKSKVRALRNVSFDLEEGEIVGFIGPNGAGKTTTLKVLSGLLYPTSGSAEVLGFNPFERNSKFLKSIALVMGQKNQLWWDLPAKETFELNRAIYEIPDKKYKRSMDELVDLLEVKKLLNTQVRQLSLGQRMRLEFVAALLHRPKVLFLDEPTIGLDVVAQQRVRDFILSYNKKHKATIILTSHNMEDVASLAKRVIIIDHGRIVFDGLLKTLIESYAKSKRIILYLGAGADIKKLKRLAKVINVQLPRVTLLVDRSKVTATASKILQDFPVEDLTIEEESIESIIRKIFSQKR